MYKRRFSLLWNGSMILIVLGSLTWALFPIYWMISTSLKSDIEVFKLPPDLWSAKPTLNSYYNLTEGITPITTFFKNSVISALGTVLFAVIVAFFAGYALSRLKFKFRKTISIGILITQMFPLVVLVIPLYLLYMNLNLLNTYVGLILGFTSFTLPFSIWMIKGFIDTVPIEIEEAATIDGCSLFQMMWKVIMPLIKPGLVATAVFAFLDAWNNLLFPMTLINDISMKTLPPGMILAFGGEFKHDWSGMMAASVIVSIPVIVIFILIQRYLVEGLTKGAVKG